MSEEKKLTEDDKSAQGGPTFGRKKNKRIEELEKQIEEYKSGWQRAQADYKNLQTEIENKRSEWVKMSELQVLEDFIPVYDNFKKAFSHHPELDSENEKDKKVKNWVDGIGYIMKQFSDVLKRFEIEEIKTVGEMFNPEFHEAAGEEDSEELEGKILREIDVGYTMKGKIFKVAKVIIAKGH
ncbi:MAG: nucleotide exchange factor GrpE [Patescibacteria group bacterium]|nr:nucleotide exchange factor GrpE [Patescibacteria group bacterium]